MSNVVSTIPLLKPLRVEGGTFYSFSSAMNDAILLFSTNNINMNFSKFACLKLPDWQNTTTQRLYRAGTDIASANDTPGTDDANTFFPKAYMQNYIENFLSYVDANRNDQDYSNFAEAAFWKAMQSVADSDFNLATNEDNTIQLTEDTTYIDELGQTRQKYKELAAGASYEPIIKFVGDINMINHKKSEGKEYLEVFAHIANSQGRIDGTLLKPNDWLTNQVSVSQVPTSAGPDYIAGRETEYNTAPGTDKTYAKAIYDTIGKQYNVSSDKDFLSIDWEDIESPAALASKHGQGNFDFNAILLYYDVATVNDDSTRRRNLYGILVLDKMTSVTATTERVLAQTKYQPNSNQAGNAFGFLFNLMFSNNTNQITSTVTINDTAVVAMELYMKALEKMQVTMDIYERLEKIIIAQEAKINTLSSTILGLSNRIVSDTEINSIKQRLTDLETT